MMLIILIAQTLNYFNYVPNHDNPEPSNPWWPRISDEDWARLRSEDDFGLTPTQADPTGSRLISDRYRTDAR